MSCIITITAGNNQVEMEVPSIPSSLSELKQILSQNKKLNQLNSYIKIAVSQGNIIDSQVLKDIKNSGYVIPNTTAQALQSQFPNVEFPLIDLDTIPILLINSYKASDSELQFGIIEQNGKSIYILDNNPRHIERFGIYLKLKNAIESSNFLNQLDSDSQKILDDCAKVSGYTSKEEMVLQYLNNKNIFRQYRTSDGKSVFSILNSFLTKLGQIAPKKVQFSDETVSEFYDRLTWNFENGKLKDITIPIQEFYEQVLMYDEEIKKVIPDTFNKFYSFLSSKENNEDFESLFGVGENKLQLIIDYLNTKEPWLNLALNNYSKNRISLKSLFPNVNRVFGIGYDTIKKMTYSEYKGWFIFEDSGKFYPSKSFLNPNTRTNQYNSLEEAQLFINKQNLEEELFQNTKINLGRKRGSDLYIEGSLIRVKDFEIKDDIIKNLEERKLKTLSDFYQYFSDINWEGLIDTAEEATLFLYQINQITDRSLNKLIEIAQNIKNAPYVYYYVEQSYKDSEGEFYQRIIPAKDIKLEEFKSNHKTPVIQIFNAIQSVYGPKFGIQTEILSNDEIEEKYGVIGAKAFILQDKIVLNSTLASSEDLFHEYSHIVLGYLKAKNLEGYRNLIESVWKMLPSYTVNMINKQYKNLPMESKMEEGFVYQYSKYISDGYIGKNLSEVFKASEDFIKEGVSSIFDGETDIRKVFGEKIKYVFNRFNQEIGYLLNSDNDFLSFSKSNNFFLQRKKVNWLEKQIQNKNIIEEC